MSPRFIILLAVLTTGGMSVAAVQPLDKNDPPKLLPGEVVEAWKEAGAVVGWMRADRFGLLQLLTEKNGGAGDLPAFKLSPRKDGLLPKLPAPAAASDFTRPKIRDG